MAFGAGTLGRRDACSWFVRLGPEPWFWCRGVQDDIALSYVWAPSFGLGAVLYTHAVWEVRLGTQVLTGCPDVLFAGGTGGAFARFGTRLETRGRNVRTRSA